MKSLGTRLFTPVDIASIVFFRVAFGVLLLWEVWRYFSHDWIGEYYVDPTFHFTYFGFGWVRPWSATGMYLHFMVLGVLAACIAAGLYYRLATVLFWLGFTYVFLLEQARYLNHFYLICLFSFLLIFIPAHRALSLDVLRRPWTRSATAPAWCLGLLRAQFAIVYIFGGIAKLNPDWLRGEPMGMWLAARRDLPILGPWLTEPWVVLLFSYGGLVFDLAIVPLLLCNRTRWAGFALALLFHLTNNALFRIGVFPWFSIAATLLFFPADWPRRVWERIRGVRATRPCVEAPLTLQRKHDVAVALMGLYLAAQLLIPLRHWIYPGDVHWTEEGHRFSWRMKLRDKRGQVRLYASHPTRDQSWQVDARRYLKGWQIREMATRPDMVLQFCHFLADDLARQGLAGAEIRVVDAVSLNGRPRQLLIDPALNLAAVPRTLRPARWILPLDAMRRGTAATFAGSELSARSSDATSDRANLGEGR